MKSLKSPTVTEVFELASRLPVAERAFLAQKLLVSLEDSPFDDDCEAAWRDEIAQRLDRLEKGEATVMDWTTAYEKLQASLANRAQE